MFRDKDEEEKYKNEQKRMEEKRKEFQADLENISLENAEELLKNCMSIHETKYLWKIWNYLKDNHVNMEMINEEILDYFFREIHSMLNGSIYRLFIDENWFYELIISLSLIHI